MIKVHSFETLGTHEGPGIRSVVFTQGCNLKCVYCHNPDTQCMNGGKDYSDNEIVDFVLKSKAYYGKNGGLTVSGGEPLLQAKELIPIFKRVQELGFKTALDTSGSILNDDVRELLKFTDLVLLDVKEFDNESHVKLTGISNKKTLEFAEYLEKEKISTWIRYVLMPEYSDNIEHIKAMGEHFKSYEMVERLEILPYHRLGVHKYEELDIDYKAKEILPPSIEKVNVIKEIFEKYFKKVLIR